MNGAEPDMCPQAITERLKSASSMSDLSAESRLDGKLDMSAAAITQRLKECAALLALCQKLSVQQNR